MTDQNGNDNAPEAAIAPEAAEMVPAEQVKAALEAAGEFKDKLLRTLADMENLRKRTEREVADARTYGVTGFARDVLQVADNMHRALEAIGPELRADPNMNSLIEGVELTERELMKVLDKHGVKKFSPQGEKFDPNFHQAMYEVSDGSAAPGTVAQVVQAGYLIGERVLRPAMVAVAKAPKPSNDNALDG
ncbi:MAG: nucleotide exchange factor GrpE [Pseudolabrys sp.]|nr:nucleotide exchange factor GrpE [Pseudolabrys sp.]MBV9954383.1 nucleotide exchange factor GrpE [Pseudolabrys sp.]